MSYVTPNPDAPDPGLQRRVSLALGGITTLLAVFLVYALAEAAVQGARLPVAAYVAHAMGLAVIAVATAYVWRGQRTVGQIYRAEGLGVVVTGAMVCVMTSFTHIGYRPELTALLGLTIILVGRSALVPSTPVRTAVIAALLGGPLGAVSWTSYVGYTPPLAGYPSMSPSGVTFYILLWWLAVAAMAVAISHVIYDLRHAVDRAERLGQYALEEKIGEGGMGRVYRARHAMLRRPTAIKLLVATGDQQLERFEREVQLTAGLTHPNTIAIYDYGATPEGLFYYAMEYLDGLDLDELVEVDGPQAPGRVIHILRQVCGALDEAHRAGLIHRDIKPGNIIICARGGVPDVAKVLDFGLVKSIDPGADVSVTSTDTLVGTPLFMAPEAIKNPEAVDERSDLYALGAVGYCLLTGEPPFDGETVVEVCGHHLHSEPMPPSQRREGIAADLEAVILACLQKDPEARPDSARALAASLDACGDSGRWSVEEARRWWSRQEPATTRRARAESTTTPNRETLAIDLDGRGSSMR